MATTLLKAKDLLEIIGDAESKKMDEERRKKEKRDRQLKDLRDAFMSREIHPEVMDRLNKAVRIAAEQGLRQVEIITFPATYCNDRGRRINNQLPDWPESLEGFAKRAYDFYHKELRPLGYKLNAEVLNFAGEVPGDIAMTLKW
jgi:vacuolar-type H+-ATPase subunit I/STV1